MMITEIINEREQRENVRGKVGRRCCKNPTWKLWLLSLFCTPSTIPCTFIPVYVAENNCYYDYFYWCYVSYRFPVLFSSRLLRSFGFTIFFFFECIILLPRSLLFFVFFLPQQISESLPHNIDLLLAVQSKRCFSAYCGWNSTAPKSA